MAPASERAERLRRAGLKATGPRLAILGAVQNNVSHPSAEEIHGELSARHPSLSLSTVYTTLNAFIRAGLARRLPEVDGRLRVDGVQHEHDHAICRGCGTIYDIDRGLTPHPQSPAELPGGLEVRQVRLEYDVICSACNPSKDHE